MLPRYPVSASESSALEITTRMEFEDFEKNKDNLKIGKYLQISIGNHEFLPPVQFLRQYMTYQTLSHQRYLYAY